MPEFSDLNAVFINCSLKKDRTDSHTGKLLAHAAAVMKHNGVSVDTIYALDHQIAFGMSPDMTEHGWDHDDWPALFQRVMAADILVLGTPIWRGRGDWQRRWCESRIDGSVVRVAAHRLYDPAGR